MGERGRADAQARPVPLPVTVVMATRDRRAEALNALGHLVALPERPAVLVVDNGSGDGTVEAIRRAHPEVATIALEANLGGTARTLGTAAATTPYVAFSDDDSWWAAGSIGHAAELLDAHPRLGVLVARVLVGEERRLDPISAEMRSSPLPQRDGDAGVPVLGFMACAAVMRRNVLLDAGGFHRHFGIGGEEALVAMDVAAAGWEIAYVEEVVAHHHPSRSRDPLARRRILARNDLWTSWLRRPGPDVRRRTLRTARAAVRDPAVRAGLLEAARGLPWVLTERRPLTDRVEADLRVLAAGQV
jgi:GT2 family glycosyltransferase